jgi:pentatricopeptide repeat protein
MGGVDSNVLNNMLSIYANSIRCEEVDGLILPLYSKFKQEYNMYTFEILMEMYYRIRDFNTGMRVWNQMNNKIK